MSFIFDDSYVLGLNDKIKYLIFKAYDQNLIRNNIALMYICQTYLRFWGLLYIYANGILPAVN